MAKNDRFPRPWMEYLPDERPRLVRLCARLTGNYDAAEDLAQETLVEAWKQAANLRDEAVWRAFVFGIARNVCLRWQRRQGQEMSRRHTRLPVTSTPDTPPGTVMEWEPVDSFNLTENYERYELASLVDRAMDRMPEVSRSLLVERYLVDIPQSEMAERRGLTENALGVRLHRAKDHLQRLMSTAEFREEAMSFGLLSVETVSGWQETRLWCPRCGDRHLLGRFVTDVAEGPQFALRCPDCDHALGQDFTSKHAALPTREVLEGVKGFKPALNRLSSWWHHYFQQGRQRGLAACPFCGEQASFLTTPPVGADPRLAGLGGLYIVCSHCTRLSCLTASGMAFHTPEVQQFWRDHPRLQLLAEHPIRFENHEAVQVTFRSVTDSAILEAVLSRTTFETLSVRTSHSVSPKRD